jgi:hypothetical protein
MSGPGAKGRVQVQGPGILRKKAILYYIFKPTPYTMLLEGKELPHIHLRNAILYYI